MKISRDILLEVELRVQVLPSVVDNELSDDYFQIIAHPPSLNHSEYDSLYKHLIRKYALCTMPMIGIIISNYTTTNVNLFMACPHYTHSSIQSLRIKVTTIHGLAQFSKLRNNSTPYLVFSALLVQGDAIQCIVKLLTPPPLTLSG